MGDKLGGGGEGVVLCASHGDHFASLDVPDVDEVVADLFPHGVNADGIIDKWKILPRVLSTLRTKHGMRTYNVRRRWEYLD